MEAVLVFEKGPILSRIAVFSSTQKARYDTSEVAIFALSLLESRANYVQNVGMSPSSR